MASGNSSSIDCKVWYPQFENTSSHSQEHSRASVVALRSHFPVLVWLQTGSTSCRAAVAQIPGYQPLRKLVCSGSYRGNDLKLSTNAAGLFPIPGHLVNPTACVSSQTPAHVTASTRSCTWRAGASECPEVILAIAADTRQGQLYPFLKYLSNLFLKPSAQEI